jgi:Tol biopolymer transport system component
VAFRTGMFSSALLMLGALVFPATPVGAGAAARVSLVSVAPDGDEGDGSSFGPSISADGRYVAFASSADTLVAGDTNGAEDVFVSDRVGGRVSRVSVSSDGLQGDRDSYDPAISADGRYVAFASFATTLIQDDTNNELDVFVHEVSTGLTTPVSVASSGTQGDAPSLAPAISGDGRLVAFESDAGTLVPDDRNGTEDVFVHDVGTGHTTRVSVGPGGAEAENPSFGAALSADGSTVGFESFSARLVPDDTNHALDVFVRDLAAGRTSRVSVAPDGMQSDDRSYSPSLSADGRWVAFASFASTLAPGGGGGILHVFVHDRDTGTTELVSVDSDGTPANALSFTPSVSADGRFVAFPSEAANLVPGDTNQARDIFVRDVVAGTTVRVSTTSDGTEGDGPSLGPALSGSGQLVAFGSSATNLVSGDGNALPDVFLSEGAAR